ncbi:MAG: hypothetical protein CBE00_03435 [Planctomycetaceae bacterium TMED240]|nr:hypothetical protein [Rhodopirellula sp.]OUX07937.1 MAG: hypothetical protein CBE00_03435 [Planctomycetaceae bacterium TMED240]
MPSANWADTFRDRLRLEIPIDLWNCWLRWNKSSLPFSVKGFRRLKYHGYGRSGLAIHIGGAFEVTRSDQNLMP